MERATMSQSNMPKTKKEPVAEKPADTGAEPKPELNAKEQKEVRIIERVIENREIAPQDAFGKLTRPQIELIKRTVAKGASDDELRMFIQVCKGANLNPFLRQVHLVPRWDSREGKEVRSIQVGIDGFRAVAESSGQYAGNDDPVYDGEVDLEVSAGKNAEAKTKKVTAPARATVTVYKLMDGQRMPFSATARWEEYYPGPKLGFQWHIRPYLMLGKCAEALALRKAFPKLLSGMYAQEEMERGAGEEDAAKKIQKARDYVQNAISKASLKELDELKEMIKKSDKYDHDQKTELIALVDARVAELKNATPAE